MITVVMVSDWLKMIVKVMMMTLAIVTPNIDV